MAMLGNAVLAMWWRVCAEARTEFQDWHAHEHFPERLAVPGFRRGSRWHGADGSDEVFVMYELSDHDVLSSPAYLARLNRPTPWSQKMMPHHLGMVRSQCRVVASHGGPIAGFVLTVRLSPRKDRESDLRTALVALAQSLPSRPGLTGATLARHERPDIAETAEQKIRGADAEADWVFLASGYDRAALEAVADGDLGSTALREAGAHGAPLAGLYRLAYSATPADVDAPAGATATDPARTGPPPGYSPHDRPSPLTAPWEPIFARHTEDAVQLAIEVRTAHCNSRGKVHGGLIAALADNAMGLSALTCVRRAGTPDARGVTVSLTIDFVDSVDTGEWLEFVPKVVRAGRTLAFVEFHARAGGRVVSRGSATFRIV